MMIARRLRPLGWAAAVGAAAISFYLVSLRVAAERGDLEAIDREIAQTHRDIRQLKTELRTRASMRQLERWNGDVLALAAPSASQYIDATQLARVDALPGDEGGPLNIPQTVQVAVIAPETVVPVASGVLPAIVTPAQAATPVRATPIAQAGDVDSKRRQRVEMLEKKLLDDHTLGDLGRAAAREKAGAGTELTRRAEVAGKPMVKTAEAKAAARKKDEPRKVAARKAEPARVATGKAESRKAAIRKPDVKTAEARKTGVKKAGVKKAEVKKAEVKKAGAARKTESARKTGADRKVADRKSGGEVKRSR